MDGRRFDEWTRSLANETSRRTAIKGMVGSLAATLALVRAGGAGAVEADAKCKGNGKSCDKDKNCCSKRCKNGKCKCANNNSGCKADKGCCSKSCKNGTCECARKNDECQNDKDCCSDRCTNGNCKCSKGGSECASNKDCCGSLKCKNKTCRD